MTTILLDSDGDGRPQPISTATINSNFDITSINGKPGTILTLSSAINTQSPTKLKSSVATVLIGDSRTRYMSVLYGPPNKRPQGVMPILIGGLSGALSTPNSILAEATSYNFAPSLSPAGTIAWDNTAKTLTLTATGDTAGTPVIVSGSGFYPVYSGDGLRCLFCSVATGSSTAVPNVASTSSTFTTASYSASSADAFRTPATWGLMLNGQSLFSPIYNLGIGGDSARGINSRITDISACNPDLVIYQGGVNDLGTTTVPDATELAYGKANIDWIVANTSAGIIVELIAPKTTFEVAIEKANLELAEYCRKNYPTRVVVIDPVPFSTVLSTGLYDTDKYIDTVHLNGTGNFQVGKLYDQVLRSMGGFKPRRKTPTALDIYSATDNIYGNLLGASGIFTVGAVAAPGADGFTGSNLPSGWSETRSAGAQTCAISYPAYTGGRNGNFLRLTLLNSGVTGYQRLYQLITGISGLAAGTKLQFEAEFGLSAATLNLNFFRFQFGNDNSGSLWLHTMDCNGMDSPASAGSSLQTNGINMGTDTMVIRNLEPFVLPAGTWNSIACHIFFQLRPNAASTAQIDLLNVSARIVQ